MTKISKTNAMRILDKEKIDYKICTYDISDDMTDGISVALKTGKKVEEVYKTLVTQGISKSFLRICSILPWRFSLLIIFNYFSFFFT